MQLAAIDKFKHTNRTIASYPHIHDDCNRVYVQRNMQYKTIDTYPFPCRWQSFGPIAVLKIQKRVLHGTICTILTPLFTSYLYGMTAQQYGFIHRLALRIASYTSKYSDAFGLVRNSGSWRKHAIAMLVGVTGTKIIR